MTRCRAVAITMGAGLLMTMTPSASALVARVCTEEGVCFDEVDESESTKTEETHSTYIPGSPGAPLWSPQPGNPQQVNAPARPLTAAEKRAIRAAGIKRDIYNAALPAGCGGPPPAAPCPEAPTAAQVRQAGAPGTPGRTVTSTTVSIDEVIERAKAKVKLPLPKIGSAPCTDAGCNGTVGVPTWFWLDGDQWQSRSDSASAGGHSVTVTAKPSKVVWRLGDGQSVTCAGPGTKYEESMGWASSPDCGLPNGYKKAGSYTVTADLTYDVTVSGDANETETLTRSSSEKVTVGELQSVVTKSS